MILHFLQFFRTFPKQVCFSSNSHPVWKHLCHFSEGRPRAEWNFFGFQISPTQTSGSEIIWTQLSTPHFDLNLTHVSRAARQKPGQATEIQDRWLFSRFTVSHEVTDWAGRRLIIHPKAFWRRSPGGIRVFEIVARSPDPPPTGGGFWP